MGSLLPNDESFLCSCFTDLRFGFTDSRFIMIISFLADNDGNCRKMYGG